MNESGAAVSPLLTRTSLEDLHNFVVIHDELDLEPGRLQCKFGGGLAGHNGLRSIASALGTQDFARLRIGIGRPERKEQVTDWVLRRPTGERKAALTRDTDAAASALALLIDEPFDDAQRRINSSRD
jgi:PTH1 family peptidyl-tRNA hydrolase